MTDELTDKQHAILDATLALVGERGFHGTPMSAIAEQAGVGAGTIYRYYESKEALINALYRREKGRVNAAILEGYVPAMPVREALALIWNNALATRACQDSQFRFLDQYYNSPFPGDDAGTVRHEMMSPYVELIERGIRNGVLRDLPPAVVLSMLLGPLGHLTVANRLGDIDLDPELSRTAFEAVWESISVR